MLVIALPRTLDIINVLDRLTGRRGFTDMATREEVCFDFSEVGFVWPAGVVFLHNATRFLGKSGKKVFYQGFDRDAEPMRFLDDIGFFEDHLGKRVFEKSQCRVTTCRLIELHQERCHGWVTSTFIPWLSHCADIPQENLSEIQTCIKEIFTNIQDHAGTEFGSVFAQWYPKTEKLQVAICDFGRGIAENVRKLEPDLSAERAILRAFDEGFTTKGRPGNRGAGLHFLKQNVVDQLGEKIKVVSGGAVIECDLANGFGSGKVLNRDHGYTGTLINFELPTRHIDREEVPREDIEW